MNFVSRLGMFWPVSEASPRSESPCLEEESGRCVVGGSGGVNL